MSRRSWTKEEVRRLQEIRHAGRSMRDAAEDLGRTYKAVKRKVEDFWGRWRDVPPPGKGEGEGDAPDDEPGGTPEPEFPHAEAELNADLRPYTYADGRYIFAFERRVLSIEEERFDQILRDYSDHGGGMTAAEVARKHGLPLPFIRRVFSLYEHFKASAPFSRERIANEDLEALAEEAVEVKEAALLRKIEAREVSKMRTEMRRLRSEEYRRERDREAIAEALQGLPDRRLPPAAPPAKPGESFEAIALTTDEHLGEPVFPTEAFGRRYDTPTACARYKRFADLSAEWLDEQPGRCRRIHRVMCGDFWHTQTGFTENGTRLDVDGAYSTIYESGIDALDYGIERLRGRADEVHLWWTRGNHDGDAAFRAMLALKKMYEKAGASDVFIHANPMRYFAFRVGKTLHVGDHGSKEGRLSTPKAADSATTVAREVGGEDYQQAEHIITWMGHLHSQEVATHGRHELFRAGSLGETGGYATGIRKSGEPNAYVFRLRPDGRYRDMRRFYRNDLDPET